MTELRKLRRVLDFVPATEMKSWRDKEYYEALNRRLHREILVERPLARPARDEAVRVVDPAEWEAARGAHERQLLQEAELEHARNELDRVLAREEELRHEVEEMRNRLGPLRAEAEEKRKVALQLVGVRRGASHTPPPAAKPTPAAPSEPAANGWEVVVAAEEPDATSPVAPVWQAPAAQTGPNELEQEAAAAEDAIRRVEAEIQKVESELQTLAAQESSLRTKAPFQHKGYTLYRRTVGRGAAAREHHFFSKEKPVAGSPSPLPKGQEVTVGANGVPQLRAAKHAVAKKAVPARKRGR